MTMKASPKKEKIEEKTNKTKNMNQKPKGSVKVEKNLHQLRKKTNLQRLLKRKKHSM